MPSLGQLPALGHELGPAGGGEREQATLAHDPGVPQGLIRRVLRVAPLAELAVDEPEVVIGLGGTAPVAEPLIGHERAAIQPDRLVGVPAQMARGREIVAGPRGGEAVTELGGEVERLGERDSRPRPAGRARSG